MPNLRVDLHAARSHQIPSIGDALHRALVDGLEMEADDLFQVFTTHADGELRFSPHYPNAAREDIIFVTVIATFGYSAARKQHMYTAIVREITQLGIPQDTLIIRVEETAAENWHLPAGV